MTELKPETVSAAENAVRDAKNWLATFNNTEATFKISDEANKTLHEKLDDVGQKIGGIVCSADGVQADSVTPASETLANAKQWWAVFAKDNDIEEEAVKVVNEKLDDIGQKLAAIECK